MALVLHPGTANQLGAHYDGFGTNFALFSSSATKVSLWVYSPLQELLGKFQLAKGECHIWHGYLTEVTPGCLYQYYVDGEFAPEQGLWHQYQLPLIDPYAYQLNGSFSWCDDNGALLKYLNKPPKTPKNEVVQPLAYQGEKPNIPWEKTVIYECHVKGATQTFPEIDSTIKGKFLALAHPRFIEHLTSLGVTTIELLPVHYHIDEEFLAAKQLENYWGYNSLNFFTPHPEYLLHDDINEFKTMVNTLHEAGIEVIIDVVFNHTAEGNNLGPTLCFRGIDNKTYYRTHRENSAEYINDTGCGNTINASSSMVVRLVLDSLRYWVKYMGVDGFRFDLAPILGRNYQGFREEHAFFQAINQDPVLNKVKLIAEPWDIGPGGYQLGAFPAPWREWNDQYRDTVRRFWRGDKNLLPLLARHIHGSGYLFEASGRLASTGINFITAHDGFTLADLVSFNEKHNELNLEHNIDGHSGNFSYNWGIEGMTASDAVNSLRLKIQKNMLLTLALSIGVPMICSGSEVANSQQGNNNAYCQDNTIGWINWPEKPSEHELAEFLRQVLFIRKRFDCFAHPLFIHDGDKRFKVQWLNELGQKMTDIDWQMADNHFLGYHLIDKQKSESLLILLNGSTSHVKFPLPILPSGISWSIEVTTSLHPEPIHNGFLVVEAHSSTVISSLSRNVI